MEKWSDPFRWEKRWCVCHKINIFVCIVCKDEKQAYRKLKRRLRKDSAYYVAEREVML